MFNLFKSKKKSCSCGMCDDCKKAAAQKVCPDGNCKDCQAKGGKSCEGCANCGGKEGTC